MSEGHLHALYKPGCGAKILFRDAGWSSLVARRAHNPKVAGSNPAPATSGPAKRSGFLVSGNMLFPPPRRRLLKNHPIASTLTSCIRFLATTPEGLGTPPREENRNRARSSLRRRRHALVREERLYEEIAASRTRPLRRPRPRIEERAFGGRAHWHGEKFGLSRARRAFWREDRRLHRDHRFATSAFERGYSASSKGRLQTARLSGGRGFLVCGDEGSAELPLHAAVP